jgi:hypothetical protein
LKGHPIFQGVTSYGQYAGTSLDAEPPALVVGTGGDNAYSNIFLGKPPVLAAAEVGAGRVVFATDMTPLYPGYYSSRLRLEERMLLDNIALWLSPGEPDLSINGSIKLGAEAPAGLVLCVQNGRPTAFTLLESDGSFSLPDAEDEPFACLIYGVPKP